MTIIRTLLAIVLGIGIAFAGYYLWSSFLERYNRPCYNVTVSGQHVYVHPEPKISFNELRRLAKEKE